MSNEPLEICSTCGCAHDMQRSCPVCPSYIKRGDAPPKATPVLSKEPPACSACGKAGTRLYANGVPYCCVCGADQ